MLAYGGKTANIDRLVVDKPAIDKEEGREDSNRAPRLVGLEGLEGESNLELEVVAPTKRSRSARGRFVARR